MFGFMCQSAVLGSIVISGEKGLCRSLYKECRNISSPLCISALIHPNESNQTRHIEKCPRNLYKAGIVIPLEEKDNGAFSFGPFFFNQTDKEKWIQENLNTRPDGIDETEFKALISTIPVLSHERVEYIIGYAERIIQKTILPFIISNKSEIKSDTGEYKTPVSIDPASKLKETENLLNFMRLRLKAVFDDSPNPIIIADPETKKPYAFNDAVTELIGYSREEFAIMEINEYEAMETVSQTEARIKVLLEKGGGEFETKFRTKDGHIKDVLLKVKIIELNGRKYFHSNLWDITEKKHIEAALRKSEALLTAFFENSPTGLFIVDAKLPFKFMEMNGTLAELSSYPGTEIIGKPPETVFADINVANEFTSHFNRVLDTEGPEIISSSGRNKHGNIFNYFAQIFPLKDGYGNISGIGGVILDTTDHRRTELTLERERKRFYTILDVIPGFICLISNDYSIVYANSFFKKHYGDYEGRPCFEQFRNKKSPCMNCPAMDVYKTKEAREWEMVDEKDNKTYKIYGYPFYDVDATPLVLVLGIDISDLKKAMAELSESEERNRIAIESSNDGFTFSKNSLFLHVNNRFLEIFGYASHDEVIGKHIGLIIHRDDMDLVTGIYKNRMEGRPTPSRYEFKGIKKNGETVHIEISESITNYHGARVTLAFMRDITDRIKAERILSKTLKELARSNKELEQFAYIASHDLQEPLRKIIAFGDRLMAEKGNLLDSRGFDYLNRIVNSTKRMQNLISDLLTYSKVTSNTKPFETLSMDAVLNEVLEELEEVIKKTDACVTHDRLPEITGDYFQIKQLFQNLISNSLKFFESQKKPELIISHTVSDGHHVITFADKGIGFDEKYLSKIFTPFQRLHVSSAYEGSGIGLTICRKVVKCHGGDITAKSEPGKGAEFIVKLPLKQDHHI